MIKAVVFDMDGVIFDSEILVIDMWKIVAKRHGMKDVETVCRKCLGLNAQVTRQIFKDYYGEAFPYDTYKREMSLLFREAASGGRLKQKPGVKELLEYLKDCGVRIALASSTRRSVVCEELENGGLLSYFDPIVCGDMVEHSKPAPDIFLKACELLEIKPEEAYAVEDSYNGIRSAYRAGLHPLMVPDLMEPDDEMRSLAEQIFPSLKEVKEFLIKKQDRGN